MVILLVLRGFRVCGCASESGTFVGGRRATCRLTNQPWRRVVISFFHSDVLLPVPAAIQTKDLRDQSDEILLGCSQKG
jgi:hypothetical protein